jgi:hypothetical protein
MNGYGEYIMLNKHRIGYLVEKVTVADSKYAIG